MTDYAEERRSELEVLESIYPDELTVISEDKLSVRVEPENQRADEPYVLNLDITYTPTYPDELPEMDITCEEGVLTDEETERLLQGLRATGEESMGMAMVYTLSQYLREAIADVLLDRRKKQDEADAERSRLEEEALAKKTRGTPVTAESFAAWREKFEAELEAQRVKEEQDRIKALPPKEREEVKRMMAKLSGRALFESADAKHAAALLSQDEIDDDEEGVEEVDYERYERERRDRIARGEALSDDEDDEAEAQERLKSLNLSDEE